MLRMLDLGTKAYWPTYKLQKKLVEQKINGDREDYLLLVEHPHTYTTGRGGSVDNLPGAGVPVFRMNRGGDVTYHGPGQIVVYPIVDLRTRGRDIDRFIRKLEAGVIATLSQFGISALVVKRKTGVWSGSGKIASIGIGVRRWITFHGLALNVDSDLSYFDRITPCGLPDVNMTSMAAELGGLVAMSDVKEGLGCELSNALHG